MVIYVGSLPFKLKENDLKALFEDFGTVTSAIIVKDKITRQNKGFGFVEMPNDEEAQEAIEVLNGSEVMDRNIVVSKSEEKKEGNVKKDFSKGARGVGGQAPFKKKFAAKKKKLIVTYGDEGSEKKKTKIKSARKHKHPWQKK